jgi:hypothetical protein
MTVELSNCWSLKKTPKTRKLTATIVKLTVFEIWRADHLFNSLSDRQARLNGHSRTRAVNKVNHF